MILKPKRRVGRVFLHCSASDIPLDGEALVEEIRRWHLQRGFVDIGYHFIIDKAGVVLAGRSLETQPAAQVGYNAGSIAVCCHGYLDFTFEELTACLRLCHQLWAVYDGLLTFHGHNEVNPHKTCPVYDYRKLLNLDYEGRIRTPREEVIADAGESDSFGVAGESETGG